VSLLIERVVVSETGAEVVMRSDGLHSLVDELGDREERAKRGHPALRVSPLCPPEKITLLRDGQRIPLRQGFGGQVHIYIPLKFKRRGGRNPPRKGSTISILSSWYLCW